MLIQLIDQFKYCLCGCVVSAGPSFGTLGSQNWAFAHYRLKLREKHDKKIGWSLNDRVIGGREGRRLNRGRIAWVVVERRLIRAGAKAAMLTNVSETAIKKSYVTILQDYGCGGATSLARGKGCLLLKRIHSAKSDPLYRIRPTLRFQCIYLGR